MISGSTYWALGAEERAVLAGKLTLGSLDGTPLFQLPADQRIYAGGGGSIRPYGYQIAGPLDPNKPIGGRSSFVLNLEARIKITETIGIVPFFDGGSYYESPVPQLGRTFLYGVGLGLRYYTAFGPLRLDLATPFISAAQIRRSRSISASVRPSDAATPARLRWFGAALAVLITRRSPRSLGCCRHKPGRAWLASTIARAISGPDFAVTIKGPAGLCRFA